MNCLCLLREGPRLSWPELKQVRRLGGQVYGPLADKQ
jgi:hypothetical protein